MKINNALVCSIFFLIFCSAFPQTNGSSQANVSLPIVALLDIEPNGGISMNFTAPTEAGLPLTAPTANTTK